MKKIIALATVAVMSLSLVACANADENVEETNDNPFASILVTNEAAE